MLRTHLALALLLLLAEWEDAVKGERKGGEGGRASAGKGLIWGAGGRGPHCEERGYGGWAKREWRGSGCTLTNQSTALRKSSIVEHPDRVIDIASALPTSKLYSLATRPCEMISFPGDLVEPNRHGHALHRLHQLPQHRKCYGFQWEPMDGHPGPASKVLGGELVQQTNT